MLDVGDKAPDFSAPASDGTRLSLSELRGKVVVLYFFPAAFTPGCTAETNRFRDNYGEIQALGAEVIGISTDGAEEQCGHAADDHRLAAAAARRDGLHRPGLERRDRRWGGWDAAGFGHRGPPREFALSITGRQGATSTACGRPL